MRRMYARITSDSDTAGSTSRCSCCAAPIPASIALNGGNQPSHVANTMINTAPVTNSGIAVPNSVAVDNTWSIGRPARNAA